MTETHEEGKAKSPQPAEYISAPEEERPVYESVSFSYLDLLKGKIPDASRRSS